MSLRLFGMSTELDLPGEVLAPLRGADFAARMAQLASEAGRKVSDERNTSHRGPCSI